MPLHSGLTALTETIEEGRPWPRPLCPQCAEGHVRFDKPLLAESDPEARKHDAWEPEWIKGTFSARGECENPECRQTVQATGDYHVDYACSVAFDPFNERRDPYAAFHRIAHVHPPMLLMPIPESAPDGVREGVLRASRVLLADAGLAATALRAAVERLLTAEGIPATDPTTNKFRTAHQRIMEWGNADPGRAPVVKLLMAVKWLGNAGTHEDSDVTVEEVLRGASVLDEAFHRLYTGPDMDAQAQTINDARGPQPAAEGQNGTV